MDRIFFKERGQKRKNKTEELVFFLLETSKALPSKQPDRYNTDLIKDNQRHGHKQLVHHIRGGGEDGGDNKGKQDSILAMLSKKDCIYNTDFCQKHHKYRQFENNPKGNQQPQAQRKIFLHGWHGA